MRASLRLHRALPWPPHFLPQADEVLSINHAGKYATEPDKRLETERPVLIHKRHVIADVNVPARMLGTIATPKVGFSCPNTWVSVVRIGKSRSPVWGLACVARHRTFGRTTSNVTVPMRTLRPTQPCSSQAPSSSSAILERKRSSLPSACANAAVSAWRLPRPWSVTCPASASW